MKELTTHFPIYHVDAFTDRLFCGNPAAVCVLSAWMQDNDLYAIAKENNLPVTAFLVRNSNVFTIRWITPEEELPLCGHGSLAAAYVIFNYLEPSWRNVELQSPKELVHVSLKNELITLNFPAKEIESTSLKFLEEGLGLAPKEIYQHKNERCVAIFNTEEEIKQLKPNIQILKKLAHRGIIVTAPAKNADFISRTFYPLKTIPEDFVTGSSHCLLVPYWSKTLNKSHLHAIQGSQRMGELFCEYQDDRVLLGGKAVLYMKGEVIKYDQV